MSLPMAVTSPCPLACTKRLTRASSVTTWRARRATISGRRAGTPSDCCRDAFHRARAFAHPVVVSGAGERVLHHGVHGDEGDAVGKFHQPVPQAAAIDFHGGMRAPENRDVLVHEDRKS